MNEKKHHQIHIRHMMKEDINAVYEIERKTFLYPFSEAIIYSLFLGAPDLCFVILDNNQIVGFLLGGKNTIAGQIHILSFAIAESHRNKGLGSKLLKFFIDYCIQKQYNSIRLEVRVDNKMAISLYEHFNFKKEGIIRKYYEDNTDALLMIKRLKV
ncbi:MAG: ribosomal protein S18-alanine N-acetyltransferase [Candidatus Heimdallarchaeaceae archaeon]